MKLAVAASQFAKIKVSPVACRWLTGAGRETSNPKFPEVPIWNRRDRTLHRGLASRALVVANGCHLANPLKIARKHFQKKSWRIFGRKKLKNQGCESRNLPRIRKTVLKSSRKKNFKNESIRIPFVEGHRSQLF